jgi:hypothetical protein
MSFTVFRTFFRSDEMRREDSRRAGEALPWLQLITSHRSLGIRVTAASGAGAD